MVEPAPSEMHDDAWVSSIDSTVSPSDLTCEYLIIGSGAGGSVAASILASQGKDVLVIEEGGAFSTNALSRPISTIMQRAYRNGGATPILGSPTIAFGEGCCLGGGTLVNGAVIWRTPETILQEWREVHGLHSFTSPLWQSLFRKVETDLNVQTQRPVPGTNIPSELLRVAGQALNWRTSEVPRAVANCRNANRCAAGCPTGAKRASTFNYLRTAFLSGARIITDCRVDNIVHEKRHAKYAIATWKKVSQPLRIRYKNLFIAAGATQSPALVRKSKLSKRAGSHIDVHLNLKIVAEFPNETRPHNGTIYTTQIQEFENQRMLFMASNFQDPYLALALRNQDRRILTSKMAGPNSLGIFAAMVRPHGFARMHGSLPLLFWTKDPRDFSLFRDALRLLSILLFKAGAIRLYLPLNGSFPAHSISEVERSLSRLRLKNLDLVSVHGMSGCRIGNSPDNSVADSSGRIWNFDNVVVCDSSALPSSTGESPQATIMALSHYITNSYLS